MIALNLGMTGMMIWQNKGYNYAGLVIYMSAMSTFYSMITAIISIITVRKMKSPIFSATKLLSFTGALMAMFMLQTDMMSHFGNDDEKIRRLSNMTTGAVVSLIVFCLAVFMIRHASRELKKMKRLT
ncbi:hypothetical protein Hs30E_05910 [Lactococcus hodotermopsidis]|uniref:Uncharacterized protein n=2 Tax=Pseudolactococcus hodotermopsidis TaxID=2709157 RepID=A0A6A0B9C8_9LACT|nr:hypothetical protein Hs30E_05910 [Lactococcus hodotermopsidis]